MVEASEQQRQITTDLQFKVSQIEKLLKDKIYFDQLSAKTESNKSILWIDDYPDNNINIAALLEDKGVNIDTTLDTNEEITKFKSNQYDIVISDMDRPRSKKAGIELVKEIRAINQNVSYFIFCGSWAAKYLRNEALAAGVTEITAPESTLLSPLPL